MSLRAAHELREYIRDCTFDRIAEILLFLDGRPFSLRNYGMWRLPYQLQPPEKLYLTGRQVGKSVNLAQELLIHCAMRDHFRVLYLSPSQEQTNRFSHDKLKPALRYSPILYNELTDKSTIDNVRRRSFINASKVELSYIGDKADRIRGYTADEVAVDEVQDIKYDQLPIAYETMQASQYKWKRFAGTPKDMANTAQYMWNESSQHEWVIVCEKCQLCNVPDATSIWDMIGDEGPVCINCKSVLNVRRGGWCPMNEDWDKIMVGFHIPQIIIPNNVEGEDMYGRPKWRQLLDKRDRGEYSMARFANEVLGISYDEGGRIVSLDELKRCCKLGYMPDLVRNVGHYVHVVAGVDWGVAAEKSFTVLCIAGILANGDIHVLFAKKYDTVDVFSQVNDIVRYFRKYKCSRIAADAGMGNATNMRLRELTSPEVVMEMKYGSQNHLMKWNGALMNGIGMYTLDKTAVLNLLFFSIKDEKILFPTYKPASEQEDRRNYMIHYLNDILALYEEETHSGRKIYTHDEGNPDDFTHALNFATLALRRLAGQPIVELAVEDYHSQT